MKTTILRLSSCLAAMAIAVSSSAAPPYPFPIDYIGPDGSVLSVKVKGDERLHYFEDVHTGRYMTADEQGWLRELPQQELYSLRSGYDLVQPMGLGQHSTSLPTSGSPKVCVILVEFADVKFSVSNPNEYFSRWLSQEGFSDNGAFGSVTDYFKAQSSGAFSPEFKVYGPVTLSGNRSNYASTNNTAYKMVHEGAAAIDANVDFTQFDNDNDGNVDHVCVIFAGKGANFGESNAPWAHNSDCPTGLFKRKKVDGKVLAHYMCTSEIGYRIPDGIGTFVHELGHAIGLPDMYNTSSSSNDGPYFWSIMDVGCYLDNSNSPCNYSAYERSACGWHTYTSLTRASDVVLRPMHDHNFSCVVETGRDRDFYVLESRPATGWDRALPGHGMLIWHIDGNDRDAISTAPNNNPSHPLVQLVCADNSRLESYAGDPWPGSESKQEFTSTSVPAMVRWNDNSATSGTTRVDKPITDIAECVDDGTITFKFMGGDPKNVVDPAPEVGLVYTVKAEPEDGGYVYIGSDATVKRYSAEPNELIHMHAVANIGFKFSVWRYEGRNVPYMADFLLNAEEKSKGVYTAVFEPVSAGIAAPDADAATYVLDGRTLIVKAGTPKTVVLINASGVDVFRAIVAGEQAFSVATPGMYILLLDTKAYKVLVR